VAAAGKQRKDKEDRGAEIHWGRVLTWR
jgi:hypothetical protein